MVGLVERTVSRSAIWCRRLALFAIPFFVAVILLHRFGKIDSAQAIILLGFGFVLLISSILLAARAIVQLWNVGAKGGKKMITGLFLSLAMLVPFGYYASLAIRFPAINDVATNIQQLPEFSSKTIDLRNRVQVPEENNVADPLSDDEIVSILFTYPELSSRRFPAGAERVLKAVREIVVDRGWRVLDIRGLERPDEEEISKQKSEASKKNKRSKAQEDAEDENVIRDIFVDAEVSSLIFAFKSDVVIKIITEEENTLVEMRSASRWGRHDFGENAKTISKFMADLDQSLIGIAGEG